MARRQSAAFEWRRLSLAHKRQAGKIQALQRTIKVLRMAINAERRSKARYLLSRAITGHLREVGHEHGPDGCRRVRATASAGSQVAYFGADFCKTLDKVLALAARHHTEALGENPYSLSSSPRTRGYSVLTRSKRRLVTVHSSPVGKRHRPSTRPVSLS